MDSAGPAHDAQPEQAAQWVDEKRRVERLRKAANVLRKLKRRPRQRKWNGAEWLAIQAKPALDDTEQDVIEQKVDEAMGKGEIESRKPIRLQDFMKVTRY